MKKINAEVKVQNIIDWFEDGEEIVRVEIDKDGWNAALQGEAYGYEDSIYKFDLEKYDFEDCDDIEDYKNWLNDCFKEPVEVEDEYSDDEGYLINIKFI